MKKRFFPALLLSILILSFCAAAAYAYFSTYSNALGGYTIHLKYQTEIYESVEGTVKTIQIVNNPDPADGPEGEYPIFVRVRVFVGTGVKVTTNSASGWSGSVVSGNTATGPSELLFVYQEPICTGEKTNPLILTPEPAEGVEVLEGESIDVVVSYESVPAVFTEEGNPDLTESWRIGESTALING